MIDEFLDLLVRSHSMYTVRINQMIKTTDGWVVMFKISPTVNGLSEYDRICFMHQMPNGKHRISWDNIC